MGRIRDALFGPAPFNGIAPPTDVEERQGLYSVGNPALAYAMGWAVPGVPTVNESTAMNLSAVYRATSLISGSIAGLPLRSIEQDGMGLSVRVGSWLDNPGGDVYTSFEWKEIQLVFLLLHGNVYLQHLYNGAGQIVGAMPVHPTCVTPEWDASRPGGKVFKVQQDNGTVVDFDASTMTQIMGVSLDGLQGVSVLTMARMSLGGALAGDKAALRNMTTGASVRGMLTPESIDDEFEEGDAEAISSQVKATMTGPENAGGIAVMNRRLKLTPWTLSPADAQFLETRSFGIDEVGRWFGIPPHLLGLVEKSTSWGQGIAEQNRGLARYTLSPWTNRMEERYSLLLPDGQKSEFDYKDFVGSDPETEIELLLKQTSGGIITANEARRILNLPRIDDENADRLRTLPGEITPEQADASIAKTEATVAATKAQADATTKGVPSE